MLNILAAEGNPLGFLTQFGVEWRLLASQALSFCIVATALYFLVFKPVIAASTERQRKIEQGLKDADEAKARLAKAESEAKNTIEAASAEAAKILKRARDDAKAAAENADREARRRAAEIKAKSDEQLKNDKAKMMAEMKTELSGLVVQAAKSAVGEILTDAQRSQLAEMAMRKISAQRP